MNLRFSQLGSGGHVKGLDFTTARHSKKTLPARRPRKRSRHRPFRYISLDGDELVTSATVEDANGVIPDRGGDVCAVRGEFNS